MANSIRFLLGHEPRELTDVDPTMTVLEYLRRVERRCGTKEGCAEGDCGACTVVLGEAVADRLRYRAVNSCIQFVATLDGKQLIAVEHLKDGDTLHPAQQAMAETNGSQCGFCTPGFVMSLFAFFHSAKQPKRGDIEDALAGNLCRCTGYGPILAAARRMYELGRRDRFDEREKETVAALGALRHDDALELEAGPRHFAPRSADELADLLLRHPDACLLAGGTDVGLWVTKQHRRLDPVIYLGEVDELRRIGITDTDIEIGAAVTYTELQPVVARHYPDFGEVLRRLGSVQIRNMGTMGGNIANGSPIGDSMPPLIALGARLMLRRGAERRQLALENFFLDYGKQDRRPGEFVERILLPVADPSRLFACYKISKRFDQDITAVLGAFNLKLRDGTVEDIRICFGGMAGTPKRARACEAALLGKAWNSSAVAEGQLALRRDYAPISDMRASRQYRARVAENLLLKFFIETAEQGAATRVLASDGHG